MSHQDTKKIQQLRMLPETHFMIKDEAESRAVELSEMYENIIMSFIENSVDHEYLSSPKIGTNTSIWINPSVHNAVKRFAKNQGVSMNRVIYTAVKLYANTLRG